MNLDFPLSTLQLVKLGNVAGIMAARRCTMSQWSGQMSLEIGSTTRYWKKIQTRVREECEYNVCDVAHSSMVYDIGDGGVLRYREDELNRHLVNRNT